MSRRRVSRRSHSSASSLPTAKELSELDKLRQSEVVMKARIRTVIHYTSALTILVCMHNYVCNNIIS